MKSITFDVPGVPRGKARPRVVDGHAYTPHKTKAYEIIKAVNEELKAMGKITIRGKAPRGYTLEKLAIKKPADLGNRQARG